MLTHAHYHEISADTPYEMGVAMGRAFGKALKPFLGQLQPPPATAREYISACFALTAQLFPDYAAEVEGYAAGAGVARDVLWHMLLEDDANALKCTSFATNNGQLVAHNEDWDAEAASRLFILRRNLKGRVLFELHYAGTLGGNAFSINETGMVQTINSLGATPVDMSMPRIPSNIIGRFMAESTDIDASIATLRKMPRMGGYAHSLIKDGEHCVVEFSQSHVAVKKITAFPFVHTNHYTLDGMEHLNTGPARIAGGSSHQRYATACEGAKTEMGIEEAKSLLAEPPIKNPNTIGGVVLERDKAVIHMRLASEAERGWLAYNLDFLR